MRKTSAAGNVSGEFENYVEGVTAGTTIDAQWGNDVQRDLIAIQEEALVPEADGADAHLLKALQRIAIERQYSVGDVFEYAVFRDPGSWDINDPDSYFPAICLNDIDGSASFSGDDWPWLITKLRAEPLRYGPGTGSEATGFSGSVSGSVFTLDAGTENDELLTHLASWQSDFGTYTNWLNLTISGVEYPITDVDSGARTITVSGSPPAGPQSGSFYPHRVAGDTTVFRLHEVPLTVGGAPDGSLFRYIHGGRYLG